LKRVNIHVLREAKYGPPFAPSFVSSRFHCRDEYVNTVTHFIQQAAMYLPNARSASIRQNNGPNIFKNPSNLVALHRCSNLFRSGSTEKGNLTARLRIVYSLKFPVPQTIDQLLALVAPDLLLGSSGQIGQVDIVSNVRAHNLPYLRMSYLYKTQSGSQIFYPPSHFPVQTTQISTKVLLNPG
jgi:hypothetical protein